MGLALVYSFPFGKRDSVDDMIRIKNYAEKYHRLCSDLCCFGAERIEETILNRTFDYGAFVATTQDDKLVRK